MNNLQEYASPTVETANTEHLLTLQNKYLQDIEYQRESVRRFGPKWYEFPIIGRDLNDNQFSAFRKLDIVQRKLRELSPESLTDPYLVRVNQRTEFRGLSIYYVKNSRVIEQPMVSAEFYSNGIKVSKSRLNEVAPDTPDNTLVARFEPFTRSRTASADNALAFYCGIQNLLTCIAEGNLICENLDFPKPSGKKEEALYEAIGVTRVERKFFRNGGQNSKYVYEIKITSLKERLQQYPTPEDFLTSVGLQDSKHSYNKTS